MSPIIDAIPSRDSVSLEHVLLDTFQRSTYWRLVKHDGDVYTFIDDLLPEARHILRNHRAYDQFSGTYRARFFEIYEQLRAWLADPTLHPRVKEIWTPKRLVRAVLHRLFLERDPYEVVEAEGNLLVTAGKAVLLNLLKGDADTPFSNANAHLGVGDSTTAVTVGQTDLQAPTNKLRKAMNATYPIDTAPTIDFQSTFGSSEANFTWNEVGTFNAASGGSMLNRVVQALGTKTSGATWTLTETITWN